MVGILEVQYRHCRAGAAQDWFGSTARLPALPDYQSWIAVSSRRNRRIVAAVIVAAAPQIVPPAVGCWSLEAHAVVAILDHHRVATCDLPVRLLGGRALRRI